MAAEEKDRYENIFNEATSVEPGKFKWRYGFYWCFLKVRVFFLGEKRKKKEHDKFSDTAEVLLSSLSEDKLSKEFLEVTGKLLKQQRMLDNSHARRRLEHWATNVISRYLIVVLLLIIVNGIISIWVKPHDDFISSGIMAAILSTTTINILGLVVIVLKGHFKADNED